MISPHLERQLEELQLISCSLLPGELFVFLDHCDSWNEALEEYNTKGSQALATWLQSHSQPLPPPCFQTGLETLNIWFEITLPNPAPGNAPYSSANASVSVKGEDISRSEQEYWQQVVKVKMVEIGDTEFPIYQLISLHLLPLLHEKVDQEPASTDLSSIPSKFSAAQPPSSTSLVPYHALFTSHHLVSPTKRRSLQHWSSSLSISGFAKVGYPGVIYAQGSQEHLEEFVDNVKSMQWLAMRLRFLEPLHLNNSDSVESESGTLAGRWIEFQKVGEVMDEMRRIGREKYVVEMGIGSAGKAT